MLAKLSDQRKLVKKERKRRNIPTIAVVGYTNSGGLIALRVMFIHEEGNTHTHPISN